MNAQEFANSLENPVLFIAGVGCPGGQSIALLAETDLPFDLSEIEGEVKDGIFEGANLTSGPGAYDWKYSDWRCNTIYKVQVFDDAKIYAEQAEEAGY